MHDPASNPAAFLGAELRRARVAAGFTSQEALAARLGYDRTVIAKAETGERPPTPEVADALEAELFAGGRPGWSAGWRGWRAARTGRSRRGSRTGWRRSERR
jgi:transcriptional regulator with XRE-family HTH domain